MTAYVNYLNELKRIADDEIEKGVVPHKNKIEELSADLAKQRQENNDLFLERKILLDEYNELQKQKQEREAEQKRIAEEWAEREFERRERERERERERHERERLFWNVFSIASGGIIGGVFFAYLTGVVYNTNIVISSGVVIGFFTSIYVWRYDRIYDSDFEKGCLTGFGGLIVGAIIGAILGALLKSIPFAASVVIGIVVGASIGYGILKGERGRR